MPKISIIKTRLQAITGTFAVEQHDQIPIVSTVEMSKGAPMVDSSTNTLDDVEVVPLKDLNQMRTDLTTISRTLETYQNVEKVDVSIETVNQTKVFTEDVSTNTDDDAEVIPLKNLNKMKSELQALTKTLTKYQSVQKTDASVEAEEPVKLAQATISMAVGTNTNEKDRGPRILTNSQMGELTLKPHQYNIVKRRGASAIIDSATLNSVGKGATLSYHLEKVIERVNVLDRVNFFEKINQSQGSSCSSKTSNISAAHSKSESNDKEVS